VYFNDNSVAPDQGVMFNEAKKGKKSVTFQRRQIAFVLSIYFCYVIRMGSMEQRDGIIKFISTLPKPSMNIKTDHLKIDNFKAIIRNEQNQFIQ
jgi:hypothetical protein